MYSWWLLHSDCHLLSKNKNVALVSMLNLQTSPQEDLFVLVFIISDSSDNYLISLVFIWYLI